MTFREISRLNSATSLVVSHLCNEGQTVVPIATVPSYYLHFAFKRKKASYTKNKSYRNIPTENKITETLSLIAFYWKSHAFRNPLCFFPLMSWNNFSVDSPPHQHQKLW